MEPSGPLIINCTHSHLCFRFPFVITLILFYSLKLKKIMTPAVEIYLYCGGRKVPPPSRPISIELYFGTLLKASAQRKQVKYHWKVQIVFYCGTWKRMFHKDLIGSHSIIWTRQELDNEILNTYIGSRLSYLLMMGSGIFLMIKLFCILHLTCAEEVSTLEVSNVEFPKQWSCRKTGRLHHFGEHNRANCLHQNQAWIL